MVDPVSGRKILPETINKIFRRNCPTYFLGDLNARHKNLGHSTNNLAGRMINDFMSLGTINWIGPDFKTVINPLGSGKPDIILTNNACFHHTSCTPGPITTSDHIPIIFEISSSPQLKPSTPKFIVNNANWEQFKARLSNEPIIDLNFQPVSGQNPGPFTPGIK